MIDIARPANAGKQEHRNTAVESAFIADYDEAMENDIAVLMGRALRAIRLRTTRTQDEWAARTGMSQSYLSAAERGRSGWESVRTIAAAVHAAGADPLDLLQIAAAESEAPEQRELVELWSVADSRTREAILTLLRAQAPGRLAVR